MQVSWVGPTVEGSQGWKLRRGPRLAGVGPSGTDARRHLAMVVMVVAGSAIFKRVERRSKILGTLGTH